MIEVTEKIIATAVRQGWGEIKWKTKSLAS